MTLAHDIPFLEWMGAVLLEWGPAHAVIALDVASQHLNRSGVVHGGIYAVLADASGGLAGCYGDGPGASVKSYTLSLSTSFLGTARHGRIVAHGTLRKRGRRIYFSTVEVRNDGGDLIATAEGSFMYRSADAGGHAPHHEGKDTR